MAETTFKLSTNQSDVTSLIDQHTWLYHRKPPKAAVIDAGDTTSVQKCAGNN